MHFIGKNIVALTNKNLEILKIIPYSFYSIIRDIRIKRKSFSRTLSREIFYSGVSSVPMVMSLGLFIGFITVFLFPFDKINFGITNIYGSLYSIIILQYFAPVMTSLIVIIRSTIYITVQITQMKIGGEIDTIKVLGIDPIQYLGSVRVLAGVIVVPILTIYFLFGSFFSGMLSANILYNVPFLEYILQIKDTIDSKGVVTCFLKTIISGIIIFKVAIYYGLSAEKDRTMIISKTIRAITVSIVVILAFNFIATFIVYL